MIFAILIFVFVFISTALACFDEDDYLEVLPLYFIVAVALAGVLTLIYGRIVLSHIPIEEYLVEEINITEFSKEDDSWGTYTYRDEHGVKENLTSNESIIAVKKTNKQSKIETYSHRPTKDANKHLVYLTPKWMYKDPHYIVYLNKEDK